MQVITKEAGEKTINITPRNGVYESIVLKSETSNGLVVIDSFEIIENTYYKTLTINIEEELIDNSFYSLSIFEGSQIIYRDKIFVTSQDNYTVNADTYITRNTSNEFITI